MGAFLFLLALGLAVVVIVATAPLRTRARRTRLRARAFPEPWRALLRRDVCLYRRAPEAVRTQLHGHIHVFLAEKTFYGCGGQTVTQTMRLIIAAQACLLLLNRATDYFPGLQAILVYPSAFIAPHESRDGAGVHTLHEEILSGESWHLGKVVLAWDEVFENAKEGSDRNVVLHEFAHQLDEEDGGADGAPVLESASDYEAWSRIFNEEFQALRDREDAVRPEVIDPYAGENPAEFFAVATETFFTEPVGLREQHPKLYEALERYYRVDPSRW